MSHKVDDGSGYAHKLSHCIAKETKVREIGEHAKLAWRRAVVEQQVCKLDYAFIRNAEDGVGDLTVGRGVVRRCTTYVVGRKTTPVWAEYDPKCLAGGQTKWRMTGLCEDMIRSCGARGSICCSVLGTSLLAL